MNSILQSLEEVEPSPILYTKIDLGVAAARYHRAKMRIITCIGGALLSVGALIPTVSYAAHEFYASGFDDYLSFALSYRSDLLSSWSTFGLLLFDSLPALGILGVLVCVVACVWSLSRIPASARIVFSA